MKRFTLFFLFVASLINAPTQAAKFGVDRKMSEIHYDRIGACLAQKSKTQVLIEAWAAQQRLDGPVRLDQDEILQCGRAGVTAMRLSMPRLISVVTSNLYKRHYVNPLPAIVRREDADLGKGASCVIRSQPSLSHKALMAKVRSAQDDAAWIALEPTLLACNDTGPVNIIGGREFLRGILARAMIRYRGVPKPVAAIAGNPHA